MKFYNLFSEELEIQFGVPQGSKLGPILFNLYINEIIYILNSEGMDVKLFADDFMISFDGFSLHVIEKKLSDCLDKLYHWISKNQLKINIKKSVFMIIHDQRIKNIRNNCKLLINGHTLNYVSETKYLGIIIDDNLNFKQNAEYTMKKIITKINIIRRLNNNVTHFIKCQIYKIIVFPHFEYCNTLMINYNESILDKF